MIKATYVVESSSLFRPIGDPVPADSRMICASIAQARWEVATKVTEMTTSFIFKNGSLCQLGQTSPTQGLFPAEAGSLEDQEERMFSRPLEKRPKGLGYRHKKS